MRILIAMAVALALAACSFSSVDDLQPTVVRYAVDSPGVAARGIKLALLERQWTVSSERPGYIEARLVHLRNTVVVAITFDASQASIAFVSGHGEVLRHTGKPASKPNAFKYERWIAFLAQDIGIEVRKQGLLSSK